MSRSTDDDESVHKRSGWLIPLSVFVVTFVLSAMFLLLYLAPSAPNLFEEQIAPTSRSDVITLSVSGRSFHIPANYLIYASERQGGERGEIAFYALLPDMSGWSNWASDEFSSNSPDSRIVYLAIRKDKVGLNEADKLKRVYLDYVTEPHGRPGPYDLRQFKFREDTGYRAEDLFVGETANGPVVMRCVRPSHDVPSPACLREMLLSHGIALTYRFKRTHLAEWRDIATNTDRLIASFAKQVAQK